MSDWIFLLFNVCCVFCNIENKLNHLQNGFNDAQLDDLIEQLDLRSCSIMIMEPHEKTTMSWNNIKLKLCSKLSCYSNNGDNAINIASGLTLLMTFVDHQMFIFSVAGQHDVGGSTCVASVWRSVPQSGPEYQRRLCQGKKRCYGLVLGDNDSDLEELAANIYEPTLPFKYSRAAVWILMKPVKVKHY